MTGNRSGGDVDYGAIGASYSSFRRPDRRIAAAVADALGDARTVLNVGAGAGGYEPADRTVVAVEPSATMRAQRPPDRPVIAAAAEALPFPDNSFDAAMTTFSVHQWRDLGAGVRELRRVTRGPVIVLTSDPARLDRYWLADYVPEVIATEVRRHPAIETLRDRLGGTVTVTHVPIPLDCTDGFNEAYYGRPELLLDPMARRSCSSWSFVGADVHERFVRTLRADLDSGRWDSKYGALRQQPSFDGSLVLVRAEPG